MITLQCIRIKTNGKLRCIRYHQAVVSPDPWQATARSSSALELTGSPPGKSRLRAQGSIAPTATAICWRILASCPAVMRDGVRASRVFEVAVTL
jgi:hypothetical protein